MATNTTRSDVLTQPGAAPMLNGRCVARLDNADGDGTVLTVLWHEPGCEHQPAAVDIELSASLTRIMA